MAQDYSTPVSRFMRVIILINKTELFVTNSIQPYQSDRKKYQS